MIGTGGNAGSQTVGTIIRGIALGEIQGSHAFRVIYREWLTGVLLGTLLGGLGFFYTWALHGNPAFAAVIGLAILFICMWANSVGAVIPLLAKRFGIDPAVVSAPLISTLVDATGLVIFYTVAIVLLIKLGGAVRQLKQTRSAGQNSGGFIFLASGRFAARRELWFLGRTTATRFALVQVVEADCPGDFSSNPGDRQIMASIHGKTSNAVVNPRPDGGTERRQWPRVRLRDAPGTLGWCEEDEQLTCGITVVDISGAGAAVLAGRSPPVNRAAWMRLDAGAGLAERVEARVVSSCALESGKWIVRMQFTSWIALGNTLEQHEEHRVWQRYPARETHAKLAWLDPDQEHTFPGELMNISGGGAAVITDAQLPAEQSVWLTLCAGPAALTPVECRLVAISIDASGLRIARLRFVEPCPMQLFEIAVHGAPSEI